MHCKDFHNWVPVETHGVKLPGAADTGFQFCQCWTISTDFDESG